MIQIVAQNEKGFFHPPGHPQGLCVPNHHALFTNLASVLHALGKDNQVNVYYTLAHHAELGKPLPSRKEATFEYQSILPLDIDHCDASRAFDYLTVIARILAVPSADLILISTGNGLHILANLSTPIRSTKYLKELKAAYNEIIHRIAKALEIAGLPGKPDPVVFDAARVFRLPETINRKPGAPDKVAKLLQYSDKQHAIDLKALSGVEKLQAQNISPEQIRRQFPKPDFEEIVKECYFVKWAMEKPGEVHEPQLFDLFSLLAAQSPGVKTSYCGSEQSSREVGQSIMENATASASLARQDFERKWEDSSRYGARKCSTISSNWIGGCEQCPHFGKISTPLALKSPNFVGSEDLGFWVLGKNGTHLHPHYGDLVRVYQRERSFVVLQDERIFNFGGRHYDETTELTVKSWLEKKITPNDPLREAHCNEFVKKVARVGAVTKLDEDDLFIRSTTGKLNCRNGVIDILKGEMVPHAPQLGFQYVLPYDYVEGESSELFLDWLATITESRPELMEAILDVMAYCLWPSYDDHMFTYLVGEGANGKSTLLHIIQAMLGRENFSAVSMQQLGSNRFAPANLEGKLANLSEESSGHEMSFEEMNIIKNLSSGGEMMAERKGKQGFTFHNKAKMIFSANKPPKFKENGLAIQRRMLVIPFDHTIKNPDARIEKKLLDEVPKIVSLLVRRIQENVKKNEGRFVVFRGGTASAQAQKNILMTGNSVVEWAKERLESTVDLPDDRYISAKEAYSGYLQWCEENNYYKVNKGQFSHYMYTFVVTPAVDRNDNRVFINGAQSRVFKRTRWKELEV